MPAKAKATSATLEIPMTEAERHMRVALERKTDQELIACAVAALEVVRSATAEYDLICEVLGNRFPGEKLSESIITEMGIADRKIDNRWMVDDSRIDELRLKCSPAEFAHWFQSELMVKVPDDRARELRDLLGKRYDTYFIHHEKWSVTAAGRVALRSNPKLMRKLSKVISVVSSASVKVRPVRRAKPLERT